MPLEVRIGINTGEVVLRMVHTGGHTEYTPVGHAANLAARMQTVGPAGGIVISEDTRHLVEGYFELRDLGPTEIKASQSTFTRWSAQGCYEAISNWQRGVGSRSSSGAKASLSRWSRALELARGGHGQIVAVVAEAGTGKSRLFYEFRATLPAIAGTFAPDAQSRPMCPTTTRSEFICH